jgi:hypothetical protein
VTGSRPSVDRADEVNALASGRLHPEAPILATAR